MRREDVLDAWEAFLKRRLQEQDDAVESAQSTARDSPGANVTRSDQNRFNYSNLALGLEQVKATTREAIDALQRIREHTGREKIQPGSVVQLLIDDQSQHYLIIPYAQGDEIVVDSVKVTVLSTKSPLGLALLGSEVGDDISFRDKSIEVTDVL